MTTAKPLTQSLGEARENIHGIIACLDVSGREEVAACKLVTARRVIASVDRTSCGPVVAEFIKEAANYLEWCQSGVSKPISREYCCVALAMVDAAQIRI